MTVIEYIRDVMLKRRAGKGYPLGADVRITEIDINLLPNTELLELVSEALVVPSEFRTQQIIGSAKDIDNSVFVIYGKSTFSQAQTARMFDAWAGIWRAVGRPKPPALLFLPDDLGLTTIGDAQLRELGLMRVDPNPKPETA